MGCLLILVDGLKPNCPAYIQGLKPPRLECSGTIMAHCSLNFLESSNPLSSASRGAGTTDWLPDMNPEIPTLCMWENKGQLPHVLTKSSFPGHKTRSFGI
ncbi:serine/threonine-protein kinase Nek4-like isoform X4 [Pan troglodytes]|uniref:serine/threonine-protein kinase Nek4-like isoform X4 n=1 Tax=Pan troglodytes TaxID=9598 RepID=UPI00301387A9